MKKNISLLALFCLAILESCANDPLQAEGHDQLARSPQQVVNITSYGSYPSSINSKMLSKTTNTEDDFTEMKQFESSESAVLPHLNTYIFPGSLLKGNSIQNLDFKPIAASIKPITVSLSIPALNKKAAITIDNPSLSATRQAVQNYIQTADFTQNGTLNYSIEQFTSYDELKVAFGSNVNTRSLFGKNSSSTNIEEGMISKRTGFYIKFYQTSFTLDMDIPAGGSLVNDHNFDSGGVEPVYVSSISYGRMGILSIETNEQEDTAKKTINETFSKLFVKGESYLTEEEKSFLNGADFKLYLIGGNGVTAAQSFQGYQAFVNHVAKGTFSKSEPGVPIFCSYSYLNDNSLVKTVFKFDIKKKPVYVELKVDGVENFRATFGANQVGKMGKIKLFYYDSRSKTKTIAPPYLKFKVKAELISSGDNIMSFKSPFIDQYSYPKELTFHNAGGDIYTDVTGFYSPTCLFDIYNPNNPPTCSNPRNVILENVLTNFVNGQNLRQTVNYKYTILPDPNNNYIVVN
ncbi:MAG: thiol-activated cytolysin family protein [Chryseobacterium sp.]|jgi:thiol-activated cytolysin|uniref:thiol-activated cytolysin family protein n=1 Tax=Chryseobacterium sp. TaxID=1871047 RepID=UPI002822DE58|nr:thiol-activated cytolysin family protein [Chryseobacterium sp.]MDR2236443.1 thiol-activated cytolysin family protein [Chryseobacterium sp.]